MKQVKELQRKKLRKPEVNIHIVYMYMHVLVI